MEGKELQEHVLKKDAQERFQKSSDKSKPILINIFVDCIKISGPWSRGYDVALTWRRSPVQFWPSPFSITINPKIYTIIILFANYLLNNLFSVTVF